MKEIILNRALDLLRAGVGRTSGEAELDRRVSLVFGWDEACWKASEQDDEEDASGHINQKEQPLAFNDAANVADVPVDASLEMIVELLARRFETVRNPWSLAPKPCLFDAGMLSLQYV